MRVVMLAHSFPRGEGDFAGSFIWRLAEALVDRGHRVLAIAPADRGDVGAALLGRVEVRRVRYAASRLETLAYRGTMHALAARSPLAALAFVGLVRAFARAVGDECRRGDVNVVHAHWWVPGGLAATLAARHGRPLVVTLHGTDVTLARKVPGGSWLMRTVLRRAAAVTAVSTFLADRVAGPGGPPRSAIELTPMPLVRALPRAPLGARQGAVYVGRLTSQKGVAHLLDALAILKRRGSAPELTILGDGPDRAALKAQALALGVRATFFGFVPPEQVADYLDGKRVLVLPSVAEGLGLVVAEALTQGIPVVATRSGGIPDLLTAPDAGLLVPPGDPASLADAIGAVLADERFLAGAQRAGRGLATRLSPERVAETFEQVYARARLAPGGR
ncbi:MAG: glycosyltransferase family 4 protein [Gemmatimonadetes bacterium]|nr:glycosyltransferase family 4 protein [Gemmatimonadota bacterium]